MISPTSMLRLVEVSVDLLLLSVLSLPKKMRLNDSSWNFSPNDSGYDKEFDNDKKERNITLINI